MYKLISQGHYGFFAGDLVATFSSLEKAQARQSLLFIRHNHQTVLVVED